MPKSGAERTRIYLTRKRRYAREVGLCYTCCKAIPSPGRSICISCNTAAVDRKKRKRQRDREAAKFHHAVTAHEQAGDFALSYNFHDGAAKHYQDALRHASTPDDHVRISEKLSRTLFLGNDPKAASRWLKHALRSYTNNPEQGNKLAELLLEHARQLWAGYHYKEALPELTRAIEISRAIGNVGLIKRIHLMMASFLLNHGRLEEAKASFDAVGGVEATDDPMLRRSFFSQKALFMSRMGIAREAYHNFERALEERTEISLRVDALINYAHGAKALGNAALAKMNFERALLLARQNQLGWRIPYICLLYAEMLTRLGHYDVAHQYLVEGLAYETPAPVVELVTAECGIRLALEMKDSDALKRCSSPHLLVHAFKSHGPMVIGPVAAAFARLYAAQGKHKESQAVLHRALHATKHVYLNWDLFLEIARQGRVGDFARARSLLEERVALPSSAVARAYLQLFDAFVAQRRQQKSTMQQHASEAVKQFERLQWFAYADLARTLLPAHQTQEVRVRGPHVPFVEIRPLLTTRERQVAELVLKGLPNRVIAEELSLSENTVETHMASIMSRLGIRSRHQLVDVFTEGPGFRDVR